MPSRKKKTPSLSNPWPLPNVTLWFTDQNAMNTLLSAKRLGCKSAVLHATRTRPLAGHITQMTVLRLPKAVLKRTRSSLHFGFITYHC